MTKSAIMPDGNKPPVDLLVCTDRDQIKVEYATASLDHQRDH
jgi:hypothetical protein